MVLAIVAAAIVVGFVVAAPGDEDDEPATQTAATQTETETTPADTGTEAQTQTQPQPEPQPRPPVVVVRGGEPVGGVRRIRVQKDEQVRFSVRSDAPDHVHVHGYDIFKDVAPGQPARFGFKADIEGVFEVELEDRAEQIIRLTVEP